MLFVDFVAGNFLQGKHLKQWCVVAPDFLFGKGMSIRVGVRSAEANHQVLAAWLHHPVHSLNEFLSVRQGYRMEATSVEYQREHTVRIRQVDCVSGMEMAP